MPVQYQPHPHPARGFLIDDIIKHENRSKPSTRHAPPWLLPLTNNFHFHREYLLQYVRQMNHFAGNGVPTAFLLDSYRKPKRNRTAFTPSQLLKLENAFEKNHYIVGQERKDLAKRLNLPEARVKVWYQNRRTKHKRAVSDDGQSSVDELDTSDSLIKIDDEQE